MLTATAACKTRHSEGAHDPRFPEVKPRGSQTFLNPQFLE